MKSIPPRSSPRRRPATSRLASGFFNAWRRSMKPADRKAFLVELTVLAEVFHEALSDVRLEGYWKALDDLSINEIRSASRHAARTCKFFPKPAELREALMGTPEDSGEIAWMRFLHAVREVGPY